MLNVGIYVASLEPSGISRFAVNLAAGLCEMGHLCTVIADAAGDNPLEVEPQVVLKAGSTGKRVHALRHVAAGLKLQAIISNGYYADLVCLLARVGNPDLKVVSVSHSRPALWATDAGKGVKKVAAHMTVAVAHRLADEVVAVSNGLAGELRKRGWSNRHYRVLYNPVITPNVKGFRRDHVSRPQTFRIACVGWISPLKGIHLILEAARIVKSRVPDLDIGIDVIGGVARGCSQYARDLVSFAERNQIAARFLGTQSNPYSLMADADVCVLASYSEALPTVVIEALALGVPVIAADCPHGPSEILDNGRYGLLFPVGNSGALADHLLRIISDGELRRRLATEGTRRASVFSQTAAASAYEELIADLVRA